MSALLAELGQGHICRPRTTTSRKLVFLLCFRIPARLHPCRQGIFHPRFDCDDSNVRPVRSHLQPSDRRLSREPRCASLTGGKWSSPLRVRRCTERATMDAPRSIRGPAPRDVDTSWVGRNRRCSIGFRSRRSQSNLTPAMPGQAAAEPADRNQLTRVCNCA